MSSGPGQHCRYRRTEWYMAVAMLLTGSELVTWDHVIASGKLQFMLDVLGSASFTAFYLLFGMTRLVALYLNGQSRRVTAYVRAVCALAGAFAWFQMLASLILFQVASSLPPSLTSPLLVVLIVMEFDSMLRALNDARYR